MKKPKFISFEGGEGVGKSTQANKLAKAIEESGVSVLQTREPGGSPGAEIIRNLLVSGSTKRWQSKTELLLHCAARNEHFSQFIKPCLERGNWVISDRFLDSSFAYQGYGHGIDLANLEMFTTFVMGKFRPDLSVLLDLPVSVGLARAKKRGAGDDRYENMGVDFHERVRRGFLAIAAKEPERFLVIDATLSSDSISSKIFDVIRKKLM